MSTRAYRAPMISELGSVRTLTLADPPGKTGPSHDGSGFASNFSCVVDKTPGSDCAGNPASGPK